MAKRPSLAANVKAAAEPESISAVAQLARPTAAPKAAGEGKRAASRVGRKAIYAWVDPSEHKRLKQLSLELDRSIDALVAEGVQLLFAKHK